MVWHQILWRQDLAGGHGALAETVEAGEAGEGDSEEEGQGEEVEEGVQSGGGATDDGK